MHGWGARQPRWPRDRQCICTPLSSLLQCRDCDTHFLHCVNQPIMTLTRSINETMMQHDATRCNAFMHPCPTSPLQMPVPAVFRKALRDFQLGGYAIEKDAVINLNLLGAAELDPAWADLPLGSPFAAGSFNPDRWGPHGRTWCSLDLVLMGCLTLSACCMHLLCLLAGQATVRTLLHSAPTERGRRALCEAAGASCTEPGMCWAVVHRCALHGACTMDAAGGVLVQVDAWQRRGGAGQQGRVAALWWRGQDVPWLPSGHGADQGGHMVQIMVMAAGRSCDGVRAAVRCCLLQRCDAHTDTGATGSAAKVAGQGLMCCISCCTAQQHPELAYKLLWAVAVHSHQRVIVSRIKGYCVLLWCHCRCSWR
jgi:hypothetical protein